ncbi:phosphomannomutase/phosphoglucomutase [Gloeothece verrucosa]|uniref:Phosphoglucomutase/phosphomannomutase alpha/beta/alpha domain I n=1 Tax=Gloeothece verrucosa (strain PCC 7822) TaxID=497965 RepID=E0UKQ3_GLOV7|nr:phosphomannomutase/phosphoglucomutase [Gloeothece verrucosa]ADN17533.1 phosphoglucomutase/phosphomannomutase alpha/beta/alpha domain I [Gloeothece verrucosa PCC 7822]
MANFDWKKLQNGSDIRGIALEGVADEPVNLTEEVANILGKAFVTWLKKQLGQPASNLTISVGRDSRLSGPKLMTAVMEGISTTGCRVYDFDMASTPAMFMSTISQKFACDAAIMLTASHLPFNRNGFKFFTAKGGLDKQDISEILKLASENVFETVATPGEIEKLDFISVYADSLVNKVREPVNDSQNYEQPLLGLKIIVDAGNGAGGFYADKVLKTLGADTKGSQFIDPDGRFPNHIPNPENEEAMASIRQAVLEHKADLGIIFDTDVDRAAVVTNSGKELNRNRLIALISAIVLQEHPGSTIVTDSITSDGLTEFIEQDLKGIHHRFKRGYKNVINESMRLNQEGQESWLAIETSGHAALKENYFLDDGAYLVTKLIINLALLRLEGKGLNDLITTLKEPQESQEYRLKINRQNFKECGEQVIEKLQEFASKQTDWQVVPNNYEGMRISCKSPQEKGWLLLRLSLHDPVMPLNIESNVEGGVSQIVNRIFDFFKPFEFLDLSAFKKDI